MPRFAHGLRTCSLGFSRRACWVSSSADKTRGALLQELQALGEAVGIVSRGVPKALIDALPRIKYTSRFPPGEAPAPAPQNLPDPVWASLCAKGCIHANGSARAHTVSYTSKLDIA